MAARLLIEIGKKHLARITSGITNDYSFHFKNIDILLESGLSFDNLGITAEEYENLKAKKYKRPGA